MILWSEYFVFGNCVGLFLSLVSYLPSFFLITAEVKGFLNLGIHKSIYSVYVKAILLILLSVSCCAGIVINLKSIMPIIFFLFNEKWNLIHCLSHIICWKFKPKCDCLEVVAVSPALVFSITNATIKFSAFHFWFSQLLSW